MHKKNPYPFDGELYPAAEKKFQPLVFFVHFYQGNKRLLRRHIKFVNELGFDAFAFNLASDPKSFFDLPITSRYKFGMKHLFAEQIEELLNLLPGKKIIYAFSNPSASAIESIYRRKCSDVLGLICDSGPSGKFVESADNLLAHEKMIPLRQRWFSTKILSALWSPVLHKDLHRHLRTFPENFPVMTIECGKDLLIPPSHIDVVFKPHKQIEWKRLFLPEAGHLVGLRDFPDIMKPELEEFLKKSASLF